MFLTLPCWIKVTKADCLDWMILVTVSHCLQPGCEFWQTKNDNQNQLAAV